MSTQKITPFLWFDGNAEEAMNLYTSIFPNSRIKGTMPGPGGKIMGGTFELNGQDFMVLNGGPMFRFTEAISLYVNCDTQEEIDDKWNKLIAGGGEPSMCGWLKDKFGLSWQIIPDVLPKLIGSSDRKKADAAMKAMLKMKKIVIADLQRAYDEA